MKSNICQKSFGTVASLGDLAERGQRALELAYEWKIVAVSENIHGEELLGRLFCGRLHCSMVLDRGWQWFQK